MKKIAVNNQLEDKRFELLKELLLEEDREKFSSKVQPLVDEKIEDLRINFPEYFGGTITETIKYQIKHSQEEVIEALYPIIGKLIKKSIIAEITKLNEKINATIKKTFSLEERLRRLFKKKKSNSELVLQAVFKPIIEEVFVIEKESGLLKGSFSTNNIADKDMISGMLTAIKSFSEEAFFKGEQNLEDIKFETFRIAIYSFKSIYISVVISGAYDSFFTEKLSESVSDFAITILNNRDLLKSEEELNALIQKFIIKSLNNN